MYTQRLHFELRRLLIFATQGTAKSPALPNSKFSFCYKQLREHNVLLLLAEEVTPSPLLTFPSDSNE